MQGEYPVFTQTDKILPGNTTSDSRSPECVIAQFFGLAAEDPSGCNISVN